MAPSRRDLSLSTRAHGTGLGLTFAFLYRLLDLVALRVRLPALLRVQVLLVGDALCKLQAPDTRTRWV